MSKLKTVLVVFVAFVLAYNALSQQMLPIRSRRIALGAAAQEAAAQEEVQSGTPGVTATFIPFDEKDKIKYEDAVERAKKNDAEAFYWLAYYFINGDGVEKNRDAAGNFLQKAVALKNVKACYLAGLYHELFTIRDEKGNDDLSRDVNIFRILGEAGIRRDALTLRMPSEINPDLKIVGFFGEGRYYSCTNDVATGYVIGLYSTAVNGGLTYATNDIARLKRTIVKCRERIAIETEAKEKAQTKGAAALDLLTSGKGISGVTVPFVPFNEKDKIKYEETIERAEKNDAKAFYWLAYYFAKGESVDRDGDSALKFLKKAVDGNDPVACYTFGLLLENDALQNEDGRSVRDRETERGFGNLHFNLRPFGAAAWYTPISRNGNKCLTNKVAVAHVESLYQKAVDGGLSYATNDIARLHRKVVECERRITQKKMEQETRIANAEKAKALIRDSNEEDEKQHEEETRKQDDNRKRWERFRQEREYWRSWPSGIDSDTLNLLIADVERRFNCIFIPNISSTKNTNTWFCTTGKSLVFSIDSDCGDITCTFQKINSEGRIIAWGFSENRTDLEEFRYFEAEKEKRLNSLRNEWAKDRGMTLDEAIRKHNDWIASRPMQPGLPSPGLRRPGLIRPGLSRPGLNHEPGLETARARREERLKQPQTEAELRRQAAEQAKKEREQERKEREQAAEERKVQMEQLMQLREELRRQREQNNMK